MSWCLSIIQFCVCFLVETVQMFFPLSVAHRAFKPQRFL